MLCIALTARAGGDAPPTSLQPVAERMSEPCGVWLAEESEVFGRCLLLCESLPSAEHFCAMMDGRWRERGCGRRDARGEAR